MGKMKVFALILALSNVSKPPLKGNYTEFRTVCTYKIETKGGGGCTKLKQWGTFHSPISKFNFPLSLFPSGQNIYPCLIFGLFLLANGRYSSLFLGIQGYSEVLQFLSGDLVDSLWKLHRKGLSTAPPSSKLLRNH